MHSNILLSLIRKKKIRFLNCFVVIFFAIMCFFCLNASADEVKNIEDAVGVIWGHSSETSVAQINASVILRFNDLSYYNDSIKLSYHICDPEGNDIQYENERYSVVLDENNEAIIPLEIDLSSFQFDNIVVKLDIVDEKNNYWFGTMAEDDSFLPSVTYEKNILKAILEILLCGIITQPFQFAINCLVFILCLLCFIIVIKKKLLSFSR